MRKGPAAWPLPRFALSLSRRGELVVDTRRTVGPELPAEGMSRGSVRARPRTGRSFRIGWPRTQQQRLRRCSRASSCTSTRRGCGSACCARPTRSASGLVSFFLFVDPDRDRPRADALLRPAPGRGLPQHEGPRVRGRRSACSCATCTAGRRTPWWPSSSCTCAGSSSPAPTSRRASSTGWSASCCCCSRSRCPSPATCCRGTSSPSGRSRSARRSSPTSRCSGRRRATCCSAATRSGRRRCCASTCCTASILPLAMAALVALHFWRVRKDGGLSAPPHASQRRVTAWPHLVFRELLVLVARRSRVVNAARAARRRAARGRWPTRRARQPGEGALVLPRPAGARALRRDLRRRRRADRARPGAARAAVPRHAPARRRASGSRASGASRTRVFAAVALALVARDRRSAPSSAARTGPGCCRGPAEARPGPRPRASPRGLQLGVRALPRSPCSPPSSWAVRRRVPRRVARRCSGASQRSRRRRGAPGADDARGPRAAADLAARHRPRRPLHVLPPRRSPTRRAKDAPAPFRAHPGRWLETHRPDRFGCTSCHGGQGEATTLRRAPRTSASPSGARGDGLARADGGALRRRATASASRAARPGSRAGGR